MGRRMHRFDSSASSSSSEFEFAFSDQSPTKFLTTLCPADDLFYKGQLLPLHLSPRLSMVRTLFLSSDLTTVTSRHSTDSTSSLAGDFFLLPDSDSSRPSSVTDQDKTQSRTNKPYFSLSRFSSFFRNEFMKTLSPGNVKRISFDAKATIKNYLKKVKPVETEASPSPPLSGKTSMPVSRRRVSHSFSGNLRDPRKSSCPSSTLSSPSHSGVLNGMSYTDRSSMEELQSAIQGAIAHCKNSMNQRKPENIDKEIQNFD